MNVLTWYSLMGVETLTSVGREWIQLCLTGSKQLRASLTLRHKNLGVGPATGVRTIPTKMSHVGLPSEANWTLFMDLLERRLYNHWSRDGWSSSLASGGGVVPAWGCEGGQRGAASRERQVTAGVDWPRVTDGQLVPAALPLVGHRVLKQSRQELAVFLAHNRYSPLPDLWRLYKAEACLKPKPPRRPPPSPRSVCIVRVHVFPV
ncbi:hypothetical protein J6590_029967 [Homalodisca vitripennis]|nr:hypothetical protein J6590_029967 [Homalodisca vitripennis]